MSDATLTQEGADPAWRSLYRVAAIAAVLTLLFIPTQAFVFISWPMPATAAEAFALLQGNRIIGLLSLDVLYVADNVLLIPIVLALYVVLRRTSATSMALATVLGLVGIGALIASNTACDLLVLSDRYASATTEAQRGLYLAAGEALLASMMGSAYQASYLLGSLSGIIVGAVMVRSGAFGKAAGYVAVFANAFGLGLYVPVIGIWLSLISVIPFLSIWYALLAWKFWRMA